MLCGISVHSEQLVSTSIWCDCTGRLYRDSTLYKDGKHVRDLSKLNRELSKVMLVTSDPDALYLNPENAIKVCSNEL